MSDSKVYQHWSLAQGRWQAMSLNEQLGNAGSEVDRALHWKAKGESKMCLSAADRALELMDLTLESPHDHLTLKEVSRARDVLVDFFYGDNKYGSRPEDLSEYFLQFALAHRKDR